MTEKLQNLIKEKIDKLPKESQDIINAFDWVKITEEIGKKHLLGENEINFLLVEALFVLVGIERADLYETNIENEVGTTKDEAKKIAEEVFEKIFEPIANILEENMKKSLQGKKTNLSQDVNFILSGGDYSVFLDPVRDREGSQGPSVSNGTSEQETKLIGTSNILETKRKLID